jgi:hypothetical protein
MASYERDIVQPILISRCISAMIFSFMRKILFGILSRLAWTQTEERSYESLDPVVC